MPRPRFARLQPARRDAILDAAAAEFGEHGFSRASYNRIIESAGLSKGAMYYYFDDKHDLFVTVVRDAVDRLFDGLESVGPVDGVEAFWSRVEAVTASAWTQMMAQPRVARLVPMLIDPRHVAEAPEAMAVMHERAAGWLRSILAQGHAVGAVRDDLPDDLLLAVTLAVGEAIDRWVARRFMVEGGPAPAEPPAQVLHTAVDLLRRLLRPA